MYTLIGSIIAVCFVLLLVWKKAIGPFQHIPTVKQAIPFIGNVFRIPREPGLLINFVNGLFHEIRAKTGVLWLFTQPNIFTKDVQLFQKVLKSNELIKKASAYNILAEWLGDGLLISSGEKWKTRRRLLTPAFHFNVLSSNMIIMKRHAQHLIDYMKNIENDSIIEFSDIIKYFSLDLLCETAMGIQCNTLNSDKISSELQYVKAVDCLVHGIAERYQKPWYRSGTIYRYFSPNGSQFFNSLDFAKSFTNRVIEDRIKALENVENIESNIFLDILIAAFKRNEIDTDGILEEVNTFMFEGHDTVSAAIGWTIYLLGKHKHVEEKVFQEIKDINYESIDQNVLASLTYLECVLKESMRLHPPVPLIARDIEKNSFEETHFKLPQSSQLFLFIYHLHRDQSIWRDDSSFIPERFQDDHFKKRNPFSFVPFSAGARNCIGQRFAMMELKISLLYLVKHFRFESTQEEEEMDQHIDIIHRPGNGIWMKIHRR